MKPCGVGFRCTFVNDQELDDAQPDLRREAIADDHPTPTTANKQSVAIVRSSSSITKRDRVDGKGATRFHEDSLMRYAGTNASYKLKAGNQFVIIIQL
ncbi:MAG: hypothetical protein NW224_09940 [Leptolyngbyaceae cyanobacterium bins.302]|nr:hypothetical protein [Leptolyngbyaceae cyanobacterium bins.302]